MCGSAGVGAVCGSIGGGANRGRGPGWDPWGTGYESCPFRNILDGGVSADGLTPTASVGRIKIRFGPGGDYRVKDDIWYAPAFVVAERECV